MSTLRPSGEEPSKTSPEGEAREVSWLDRLNYNFKFATVVN